jgi:hypothetical protein
MATYTPKINDDTTKIVAQGYLLVTIQTLPADGRMARKIFYFSDLQILCTLLFLSSFMYSVLALQPWVYIYS